MQMLFLFICKTESLSRLENNKQVIFLVYITVWQYGPSFSPTHYMPRAPPNRREKKIGPANFQPVPRGQHYPQ